MSAPLASGKWDFSHILDFNNRSLYSTPAADTEEPPSKPLPATDDHQTRAANSESLPENRQEPNRDAVTNAGVALGDFTKVFQLLGTSAPSATTPRSGAEYAARPATPDTTGDYATESGNYVFGANGLSERQKSHSRGSSDEATDQAQTKLLTKTQRKKQNRKARKEKEKDEQATRGAEISHEEDSSASDGPIDVFKATSHAKAARPANPIAAWQSLTTSLPQKYEQDIKAAKEKRMSDGSKPVQPAEHKFKETFKKTSADQGALGTPRKYDSIEYTVHDAAGSRTVLTHELGQLATIPPTGNQVHPLNHMVQTFAKSKIANVVTPPTTDDESTTAQAVHAVQRAMASLKRGETPATPSPNTGLPRTKNAPQTPGKQGKQTVAQTQPVQKTQSFTTPKQIKPLALVPSTVGVQPKTHNAMDYFMPPSTTDQSTAMAHTSPMVPMVSGPKPKPPMGIAPLIQRSDEDRHLALLMKLLNVFPNERKHLISPMNMTSHNQNPKGIHVFVDASNIFIGFMDALKQARGIHPLAHMPQANLSFDGLALLMERRRPVAKRVLAGSNPWLPAFDTAKNVGYEMNILDKVHKARELTERQVYFRDYDARRFGKGSKAPPVHNVKPSTSPTARYSVLGSVGGSGTETYTPQYAPAKMIEQGVDEILHLKISHTLLDYEEPSTIVLATGDAALAEYSDGFMAMVERALKKGWTVELVSWSKNISKTYLKSDWVNTWDGRFKIIYLDDFAEELLCM